MIYLCNCNHIVIIDDDNRFHNKDPNHDDRTRCGILFGGQKCWGGTIKDFSSQISNGVAPCPQCYTDSVKIILGSKTLIFEREENERILKKEPWEKPTITTIKVDRALTTIQQIWEIPSKLWPELLMTKRSPVNPNNFIIIPFKGILLAEYLEGKRGVSLIICPGDGTIWKYWHISNERLSIPCTDFAEEIALEGGE